MWRMMMMVGLAGALAACGGEPVEGPDPTGVADPAAAGQSAPALATPDQGPATHPALALELLDGEHFDLSRMRGGWVVVNFWATWCAPCLKEIPDLSELHDSRADLTVIGLAYEDIAPQDMRSFLERVPASYPIAIIDPYADAPAGDFETPRGLPMTYLIAPDGTVARRFLGPVTSREINEAIDEHAAG